MINFPDRVLKRVAVMQAKLLIIIIIVFSVFFVYMIKNHYLNSVKFGSFSGS